MSIKIVYDYPENLFDKMYQTIILENNWIIFLYVNYLNLKENLNRVDKDFFLQGLELII